MNKLYRALSMLTSILGARALANAALARVWAVAGDTDEPPKTQSPDYRWKQVLIAAAIQGVIYGVIKAAIERVGAQGYQKLTGSWPESG